MADWNDDFDPFICENMETPNTFEETPIDAGRDLQAGRGFPAFSASMDDNEYFDNSGPKNFRGRARGRGGRGGNFRGGRGGVKRFNGRIDDNDSYKAFENDANHGQRGRGGNGRGRGRGGRGGENTSDKPRETYIPPDPTENESELFNAGITTGINFDNYYNIRVQISGENIPPAIESFDQSGLGKSILDNVKKSNYVKPTPIQKRAISIILAGRDLMGCAQTGSGKTAAFLLPIISKILENKDDLVISGNHCQPQVIIISPTRELTIQIYSEARKFSLGSRIKTCIAYGGAAVQHQLKNIMQGCHILVATIGRLLDFVDRKHISFESTKFVVLDEADRMLDMGFLPGVEKIMSHSTMPKLGVRQTMMFSATFPEDIQRLAYQYLHNYIFVTVGILGGACTDVEQIFYNVDKFEKKNKLKELLQDSDTEHTLIFVETKRSADFIAVYVAEGLQLNATSIHGDRMQREREIALSDFKSGRCNILVATAVAARGLDIKNVSHVINFDLPKTIDEYVHRIGRTGRVGNRGRATSFYDPAFDSALAPDLVKILTQAEQKVPDFLTGSVIGGTSQTQEFGGEDVRNLNEGDVFNVEDNFNSDEMW